MTSPKPRTQTLNYTSPVAFIVRFLIPFKMSDNLPKIQDHYVSCLSNLKEILGLSFNNNLLIATYQIILDLMEDFKC